MSNLDKKVLVLKLVLKCNRYSMVNSFDKSKSTGITEIKNMFFISVTGIFIRTLADIRND